MALPAAQDYLDGVPQLTIHFVAGMVPTWRAQPDVYTVWINKDAPLPDRIAWLMEAVACMTPAAPERPTLTVVR